MKLQKGGYLLWSALWKPLCFFVFLAFTEDLTAKGAVGDSLVKVWEQDPPKADTDKVKLLHDITRAFYPVNPDSAEGYARKALKLSQANGYEEGLMKSLNLLGITYFVRDDHDKALRYWEKLLDHRRKRGQVRGVADIQNNIGLLYKQIGSYQKSLQAFHEVLRIRDSLDIKKKLGGPYNNLGILNYEMGNLGKAEEFYRKALRIRKERGNKEDMGGTYNNLALVHRQKGNLERSLRLSRKALKVDRRSGKHRSVANDRINIGLVLQKQGKLDSAIHYFKKARSLYQKVGRKGGEITAITNIAGVLLGQGEYSEARRLALKAYREADSIDSWVKQKGASAHIAQASASMGDSGMAYRFQKIHDRVSDSLLNKEKTEQIARMEARYQSEKRKKELEHQKARRRKAELKWQRARFIAIGGGILLLLLVLFLFLRYRYNRRANRFLEEQKKALRKERDEKELLLKEVNHRVKNNLQLINSLLSLQERRIEDQELRQLHIDSQNRIQSMGILHERIYKAGDMGKADLESFVEQLMDRLQEAYGVEEKIELEVDMDSEGLGVVHFTPVALILNELISNALKYAFEGRECGCIAITLKPEGSEYLLKVEDDGIGLSSSDQEDGKVKKEGLGLDIVRSLSEQIEGSLSYEEKENGMVFRVRFPRDLETSLN